MATLGFGSARGYGAILGSLNPMGDRATGVRLPATGAQAGSTAVLVPLPELTCIVDVQIKNARLRNKYCRMLYYLNTLPCGGDLSLTFGFISGFLGNSAQQTTFQLLKEAGWNAAHARVLTVNDTVAEEHLLRLSTLDDPPTNEEIARLGLPDGNDDCDDTDYVNGVSGGNSPHANQDDDRDVRYEVTIDRLRQLGQLFSVGFILNTHETQVLIRALTAIDILDDIHYSSLIALGGVFSLARIKTTQNSAGYAAYLRARFSALMSKGVNPVTSSDPTNVPPHSDTMAMLQARFRHCAGINASFLGKFMTTLDESCQNSSATARVMVERYARGVGMTPLLMGLLALSESGLPSLADEPILADEVIKLGRAVMHGSSVIKEHPMMKGLKIADSSVLPYLGFLSSTDTDSCSWTGIPLLSELGRQALALKSKSFATNFAKSTIDSKIPDALQSKLAELSGKMEARLLGGATTNATEEDAIGEAISEYARAQEAMLAVQGQ